MVRRWSACVLSGSVLIALIHHVGLFISGPLSHFMYEIMNKVFAGKTGNGVKIGQLLFSNLIISPIMNSG